MTVVLFMAALVVAASDERLLLEAPNALGQQGLVRTTSATFGTPTLGVHSRLFVSPDFVLPDIADPDTFAETQVAAGFSAWDAFEVALSTRAAANMNGARAQVAASVGDVTLALKGGHAFGLVAVAGDLRLGLPTRPNKVGVDLQNVAAGVDALLTADFQSIGAPVRLHVNTGYTFRGANRAPDGALRYRFDGPDGALLALATQQWFYDTVSAGIGIEAPLSYVTPFLETWFQSALGAPDYNVAGDAWLVLTPGVRVGVGGLRLDVGVDVGVLGNAGGLAPRAEALVDGQPLNPLWAFRIGVSHAFGLDGSTSQHTAAGAGAFGRLQGCVHDDAGPVPGAFVDVVVGGQPGPRLVVGDDGCVALPLPTGDVALSVSADDHEDTQAKATLSAGQTTRVDVALPSRLRKARITGFTTNRDDEVVEASVTVVDAAGARTPEPTSQGAFDLVVQPGRLAVVARAEGYLAQGAEVNIGDGERRTLSIVLRKVPRKRTAQLQADRIDTTTPFAFDFKRARLQSSANGALLDELTDLLWNNPEVKLSIEVHTDVSEVGEPDLAMALTEERAVAVRDALLARGVDGARLACRGFGVSQPLGTGDPRNRRVVLRVVP